MGTIAFAAGGAAEGLGEGLASAAKGNLEQMRQEALERLRNDYASTRQQTMIQAEKEQQQRGFTEQEKMHGVEHGEAVAAAGAQREFLTGQETRKEAASTGRANILAKSRTDVANIRAGAQEKAAGAKGPPPLLKHAGDYSIGGGVDPVTHQFLPQTKIPVYQHQDGRTFVSVGGRFMPFDSSTGKLPDSKSIGRGNAKAEQDLMNDPAGMTPDGKATKFDAFLDAYHYVPGGYFGAAQRAQQGGATGGGPLGKAAPAGARWTPAPGEVETNNAADDARADAEDENMSNENSAENTMPAQEPNG